MTPEDIQNDIAKIDETTLYPHRQSGQIRDRMNLKWHPFITDDGRYDLAGRLATNLLLFTDEQLREIQQSDSTVVVEETIGLHYRVPREQACDWMIGVGDAFALYSDDTGQAIVEFLKAIRNHT